MAREYRHLSDALVAEIVRRRDRGEGPRAIATALDEDYQRVRDCLRRNRPVRRVKADYSRPRADPRAPAQASLPVRDDGFIRPPSLARLMARR